MVELKTILRDYLRTVMTDPNAAQRVGVNWIFDDFPRDDLVDDSYPRISVTDVGEVNVKPMGMQDSHNWDNTTIQIDVWTVKDKLYDFSGTNYANEEALNLICRELVMQMRFWRDPVTVPIPRKINVTKIFNQLQPFEAERRLWRRTIRYRVDSVNSGEV